MNPERTQDSNLRKKLQTFSLDDSPQDDTQPGDIAAAQCTIVIHVIKNAMVKIPSLGNADNPLWFIARIKRLALFDIYPWLLQNETTLYPNQKICLPELIGKIQGKLSSAMAKQVAPHNDIPALFAFFTRKGEAMNNSTEKHMNMLIPIRTAKERPDCYILRSIEQFSLFMSLSFTEENPTVTRMLGWYLYDSLQRDYPHVLKNNASKTSMFLSTVLGYKSLAALQDGLLMDWSNVPAIPPIHGQKYAKNNSFDKKNKQKPKAQSKKQEKRPAPEVNSTEGRASALVLTIFDAKDFMYNSDETLWLISSASSLHVTGDLSLLRNVVPTRQEFETIDGSLQCFSHKGVRTFSFPAVDTRVKAWKVDLEVYFLEGVNCNIISPYHLDKSVDVFEQKFTTGHFYINKNREKYILADTLVKTKHGCRLYHQASR